MALLTYTERISTNDDGKGAHCSECISVLKLDSRVIWNKENRGPSAWSSAAHHKYIKWIQIEFYENFGDEKSTIPSKKNN